LCTFIKISEDVITEDYITELDILINQNIITISSPIFDIIMIFITNIISPFYLLLLSVTLGIVLLYKKKWFYLIISIISLGGGAIFYYLVKIVIQRQRPDNSLIEVSGFSFPSGHAALAAVFFCLILYIFKDDIKNILFRDLFIFSNIIFFCLIGFSRIYLRVHWLSDVIAGFALGIFWLTLLILIFQLLKHYRIFVRLRDV
jgi:undecaprenyl-diphosphatase